MTGTAEYEIKLLAEKHAVIAKMGQINESLLSMVTYLDKKRVLEYYEKINVIIESIADDYQIVREQGKQP